MQEKLIDIENEPVKSVLKILLMDKTTKKNIVWATDTYKEYGEKFSENSEIEIKSLLNHSKIICPRIQKSQETQAQRTRKKAEVFTPAWIVNKMNNFLDADWFGYNNVFNTENDDNTWTTNENKIEFHNKDWQKYIDSRRLEITCGEAPYLVSRYDAVAGDIIPIEKRIGIIDRKLRAVNENAENYADWLKWAQRAFEATYGFEYQGDNLLIARINLLLTFAEYYEDKMKKSPNIVELKQIAEIIAQNIWQMDGLKVNLTTPVQTSLFDLFEEEKQDDVCKIFDWQAKEMRALSEKLFDYVIGNPPYQDETLGDNKGFAPPVYHKFLESAYEIADKVEMIHPARFLFNAGSTSKTWNKKMLNDEHFKLIDYKENSTEYFKNTDIKGGIVISYRDSKKNFGAIETFTPYNLMNHIMKKVKGYKNFSSLSEIVITRTAYRLTDKMHADYPKAITQLSDGHPYDMSTNIFERLPQIFFNEKPNDENQYIKIIGRENGERVYKYIRADYVNCPVNLKKYKLFLPKANGKGTFGEVLTPPIICEPFIGATETFLGIGFFDTKIEAENTLLYLKTKFMRALLGILKNTQDITPDKWQYVPLQDFTTKSDIDWTKSVKEIDEQLYKKYGLDEKEIEFIETHVKEMG